MEIIRTSAAPAAIGTYSQAVRAGDVVYISGQIPLDPQTMELVGGDFDAAVTRVFENLRAVAEAAGGGLPDIVKVNIFLVDLANFATVNAVMGRFFSEPYPARAAVQVSALPRGAVVEADAIMHLRRDR